MAIPCSRRRSIILLVILPFMFLLTSIPMLSFPSCFSLAHSNDDNLIHQICSKTTNPPLCLRSFKADHRSPSADLKTLGQISIDFSMARAQSSWRLVESLKRKATDERLVAIYESCLENYRYSIDNLGDCTKLLKSGDYQGVNIRASAAVDGPVTCDDSFAEAKFGEPKQLKAASRDAQDSCGVILVIANRLKRGELLIIHRGTHES